MRSWSALATLLTVFVCVIVPVGGLDRHEAYLKQLRKTLGISHAGANISVTAAGVRTARKMQPGHLVLQIPPKFVITVQDALGSEGGAWINKCALKLPRTLPRHFVLAVFILYERHAGRRDGLWRLWLESLPPLHNMTVFWSIEEIMQLEEERAIKRTQSRQRALQGEYEAMLKVLLEEGFDDDLPAEVHLGLEDYLWAVSVVVELLQSA